MEDISQGPKAPTEPPPISPSLERRPLAEEDSASMTIEFLRARLLSERSVSKAARQRAQQLSKKISELEECLEAEIQLRKKLEADRLEILSKYRAELSEEYGEFFTSAFGECFPSNEGHTPNEEEEELSSTRAEHLDRSSSSQQLNHDDANDEDEETEQLGPEKGVLSWGRQKGSKREFGHGTDWLGRSLSQRSLASTDGESPQKKWAGKSVRQIRKRESSNLEGEPGQAQVLDDFSGKAGQPDDMKEQLQCEDEKDTEVERVLERQAELIEQFEAEENAQRAWEAKFKEAKCINQSKSSSNLETTSKNIQLMSMGKDGVAKLNEMESTVHEGSTRYSRKVHPEDCPRSSEEIQGGPVQLETFQRVASEYTRGIESEQNRIVLTADSRKEACSSSNQSKFGSTASEELILEGKPGVVESTTKAGTPSERIAEMDPPGKDVGLHGGELSCSVSKETLSQDQVLSNTDMEQTVDHSKAPAMELGKASKYKKHLSSSFRFTTFRDAEPMTSTSGDMPGFTVYKQDTNTIEDGGVGNEEILLTRSTAAAQQTSSCGFSEPRHDELHGHVAATVVSEDSTVSMKDTESQGKSSDILMHEREHVAAGNGVMDHASNPDLVNDTGDSNREEILNKVTLGGGGGQEPGRPYAESRGPGVSGLLGRSYSDFPSHSPSSMQQSQMASKVSDEAHFGKFTSLPRNRSRVPDPIYNASVYEDIALTAQCRSIDGGFDRVADVLRTLEIAKYQLESSGEQATPFAIDTPYRNGFDGRDQYYIEPPRLPSIYAAGPQHSPLPYSSRAVPPFSQSMQGWSGMQVSYGAGSSRQLANAPYMHYGSRVAEQQGLWSPPPSQGVHNSNLYHYDTRQHR